MQFSLSAWPLFSTSLCLTILFLSSLSNAISLSFPSLAKRVEPPHIQEARRIIADAQEAVKIRNRYFIDNSHLWFNQQAANDTANDTDEKRELKKRQEYFIVPRGSPLHPEVFCINKTIKRAASLLAEYDAKPEQVQKRKNHGGSYWLENMEHGKMPYNSADYKVWRNVKDYGAKGDGVTDDTEAINRAISDQNRCGQSCGSSTIKLAVVYFPPGTYLVSSSIIQYYNTQFIGNPKTPPTIKAAASFVGLGVINTNPYIDGGNGAQWYIPQSNFFRQVRNFIIDITAVPNISPAGIHWQIAQATSLQNIEFRQSTAEGNNHQGVYMENGSGGMITDLTFKGGAFGMYVGNQQFTSRKLKFDGCKTAIAVHWDWAWTFKSLDIMNSDVGVSVVGGGRDVGSIIIMDSKFTNTDTAVLTRQPIDDGGKTNNAFLVLDNVSLQNVATAAVRVDGGATLLPGGTKKITSWGLGREYNSPYSSGTFSMGGDISPARTIPSGLLGGANGGFFEKSRPQYENVPASEFTNVYSCGAKGDAKTDDTAAINKCLQDKAQKSIIFFPAGTYIVTDTIFVPVGSKIVGEGWSQIMGRGSRFNNIDKPHPVVKVGNAGECGTVEITDMLFTASGPTAGAILMEWNVKESSTGSAAMWDSHFRIGGAIGTDLQAANCPKLSGTINRNCIAGTLLLHLTSSSTAYLENVWAWVADHDLDIPDQTQTDIYVARGILIESKGPTWFYGTASEHCVLYQYQAVNAKNLFMGMIQTESPYFQSQPPAPEPFTKQLGKFQEDPTFSHCTPGSVTCAMSWGLRVVTSSNVYIYGTGLYSWFQRYTQDCVKGENCQDKMVEMVGGNRGIWLYNLFTKGVVEMLTVTNGPGKSIPANVNHYSFGSDITSWLAQNA